MAIENILKDLWPKVSQADLHVSVLEGDEGMLIETGKGHYVSTGVEEGRAMELAEQDLKWAKAEVFLKKHPRIKLPRKK